MRPDSHLRFGRFLVQQFAVDYRSLGQLDRFKCRILYGRLRLEINLVRNGINNSNLEGICHKGIHRELTHAVRLDFHVSGDCAFGSLLRHPRHADNHIGRRLAVGTLHGTNKGSRGNNRIFSIRRSTGDVHPIVAVRRRTAKNRRHDDGRCKNRQG